MPALPATNQLAPAAWPCVDDPKMFAAAVTALEAAVLVIRACWRTFAHVFHLLRWRSESLIRGRLDPALASVPGKITP